MKIKIMKAPLNTPIVGDKSSGHIERVPGNDTEDFFKFDVAIVNEVPKYTILEKKKTRIVDDTVYTVGLLSTHAEKLFKEDIVFEIDTNDLSLKEMNEDIEQIFDSLIKEEK